MRSFIEVVVHDFGKLMVRGLGSWPWFVALVCGLGLWPWFVVCGNCRWFRMEFPEGVLNTPNFTIRDVYDIWALLLSTFYRVCICHPLNFKSVYYINHTGAMPDLKSILNSQSQSQSQISVPVPVPVPVPVHNCFLQKEKLFYI
jgi:hypothetical protein